MGWDFDPNTLTFLIVGNKYHTIFWIVVNSNTSFSGHWQTLALMCYKFPFNTFVLARIQRPPSLWVVFTCTLSYFTLRVPYVFILQNNKLLFSLMPRTLLLLFSQFYSLCVPKGLEALSNLLVLDYEVRVWSSVSFEYGPIIATLLDLRSHFI